MRERGAEPLVPYPGSTTPWPCRCLRCGKKIAPRYCDIGEHSPCKYCVGAAVDPDEAAELMRERGAEPLVPYPGSTTPWPCRCLRCGKKIAPRYHGVVSGRGPCKFCALKGFDYNAPAVLYVICCEAKHAAKIGIAGINSKRLTLWGNHGWQICLTQNFKSGGNARIVEQRVLRGLREEGHASFLGKTDMNGMRGHTETFSTESVPVSHLVDCIRRAA